MAGGGDGGAKPEVSFTLQMAAFGVFALGNVSLNYFNSWALGSTIYPGHCRGGFGFPFFYTMFHMLASALASFILMATCAKVPDGSLPQISQLLNNKAVLIPIATLTIINNGLNNWSLQLVPLFMNQVIKATAPLPTSIFEYIISGKVYQWQLYAAIAFIVAGSILSNYNSLIPHHASVGIPHGRRLQQQLLHEGALFVDEDALFMRMLSESGSSSNASASNVTDPCGSSSSTKGGSSPLLGPIVCIISLLAAALKPVIAKVVMSGREDGKESQEKLAPTQILFWDTGLAFFGMLIIWLSGNERVPSIEYLSGQTANPQSGLIGAGILAFGSFLAFIFNIANYYYILYTSALTSTIGSNAVKVFLIVMSAITSGLDPHPMTIIGICMVVVAIVAYAWLSNYFKKQAEEAKQQPWLKAEPLASKGADEGTPLNNKA